MIIDTHTHTFPDRIAARALAGMEKSIVDKHDWNVKIKVAGTRDALSESTKKNGVDISVVVPVATKPEQSASINEFAAQTNEKTKETGVFSLGAIHPDNEDYKDILDDIKKKGLKRGLSITTTLILAIILLVLFSSFIIPKLGESISLIITNIFNYSNRLVTLVNDALAQFNVNYAINYDSIQQALTNMDLNSFLSKSGDLLGNAGINLIFQSIGIFGTFINAITSFIMALYLLANKETHLRHQELTFLS